MNLSELIRDINEAGWLVSSMYQQDHNDGHIKWMASLRPVGDITTAHGSGETLGQALQSAYNASKKVMKEEDWNKLRPRRRYQMKRRPRHG